MISLALAVLEFHTMHLSSRKFIIVNSDEIIWVIILYYIIHVYLYYF